MVSKSNSKVKKSKKESITKKYGVRAKLEKSATYGKVAIHPGQILLHEFLKPLNLSANALASDIKVPANRISQIVSGKRCISFDTAIRLAGKFSTTIEFWLNLQRNYELQALGIKSKSKSIDLKSAYPNPALAPPEQNIIWAAELIDRKKRVRRKQWQKGVYVYSLAVIFGSILTRIPGIRTDQIYHFTLGDLLGKDWELYENGN